MPRVLMTAFEPYGDWQSNSSWQAIVELTRSLPESPKVVTRLYPVEFSVVRQKLNEDLTANYDYVLLLGQCPTAAEIRLERFALNIGRRPEVGATPFLLEAHGPVAYQSPLPIEAWAERIRSQGVPAETSNYAGDYCCNAAFYWASHLARQLGLSTQVGFLHIPVTPRQAVESRESHASMEATSIALALRAVLDGVLELGPRPSTQAV